MKVEPVQCITNNLAGSYTRPGLFLLLLTSCLFAPVSAASAESTTLRLDSLSFVFFSRNESVHSLPEGITIPIRWGERNGAEWPISVDPSALQIPEITHADGSEIRWKLDRAATGVCAIAEGRARCEIDVPLRAFSARRGDPGVPVPLKFTTEAATKMSQGLVATRRGSRLDLASGQIQLVAAGVNRSDAAFAPGEPFYVVLSGRIEGLPAELRASQ